MPDEDVLATGRVATPATHRVSVVGAAVATAGWAAMVSFAPLLLLVALGWFIDGRDTASVSTAVRFAGALWLLGHGVPLRAGGAIISLVPLALSVFAAWRLVRAGGNAARAVGVRGGEPGAGWAAVPVAVAVGIVYGLLGALAALATSTAGGIGVRPLVAFIVTAVFAGVAAGAGALAEAAAGPGALLPDWLAEAGRTSVVAVLGVLGAGAAAAGVAIAVTAGTAADVLRSYHTGVAGQAGLTVICLLYVPTVAIWAASYLVGPGFAVGTGTVVGPLHVVLGPLPAVPMLSGLPDRPVTWVGGLACVAPVLAAAVAGALLARRTALPLGRLVGAAALSGAGAAPLLALAALAGSGSLGAERMTRLGPVWWQVGLAGGVAVALGAVLGALAYRSIRRAE